MHLEWDALAKQRIRKRKWVQGLSPCPPEASSFLSAFALVAGGTAPSNGFRRLWAALASLLAADEVPQIIGQFQPILAAHVHHVAGVVIVELGAAFGPAGAVH